jgi:hypothetical protein
VIFVEARRAVPILVRIEFEPKGVFVRSDTNENGVRKGFLTPLYRLLGMRQDGGFRHPDAYRSPNLAPGCHKVPS